MKSRLHLNYIRIYSLWALSCVPVCIVCYKSKVWSVSPVRTLWAWFCAFYSVLHAPACCCLAGLPSLRCCCCCLKAIVKLVLWLVIQRSVQSTLSCTPWPGLCLRISATLNVQCCGTFACLLPLLLYYWSTDRTSICTLAASPTWILSAFEFAFCILHYILARGYPVATPNPPVSWRATSVGHDKDPLWLLWPTFSSTGESCCTVLWRVTATYIDNSMV